MVEFFMAAVWAGVSLVVGLGVGYYVGWNRAKHPGKIESQIRERF